ncbi:MAG TPA: hypothetical protein VHV47_02010 [Opitutaceae bacterium]|jgi:hypothetical protein|nr:hypothetical protein [Opitutaceae bacterium]
MPSSDYSAASLGRSPGDLAALIHSGTDQDRLWRPDELAAIFRHQLAAPVFVDLAQLPKAAAVRLKRLTDAQGLLLKSFAELLRHPAPPVELLELTKDFAKANMDHPESAIPGPVASTLYFASIAAARVKLGTRISRLGEEDLRRGWLWAREQPWVDAETQALLTAALGAP